MTEHHTTSKVTPADPDSDPEARAALESARRRHPLDPDALRDELDRLERAIATGRLNADAVTVMRYRIASIHRQLAALEGDGRG